MAFACCACRFAPLKNAFACCAAVLHPLQNAFARCAVVLHPCKVLSLLRCRFTPL